MQHTPVRIDIDASQPLQSALDKLAPQLDIALLTDDERFELLALRLQILIARRRLASG